MREVTVDVQKWKSYDGQYFDDREICENHERVVANLNAGDLTVRELIEWVGSATFQSGADISWIGELLHEKRLWERDQLKHRAEQIEATDERAEEIRMGGTS